MSLYTPIFPSFREPSSSRKGLPGDTSAVASGKQKSHVEILRDVHLFLSTQSEVLSPPSRPNSPLFDYRVQKVRDQIGELVDAIEGDISNGKWTHVSQTLKLGCVRRRQPLLSKTDASPPGEDADWILPDEESEWIEWEKKREESRRLKTTTNVSPQLDDVVPLVSDPQKPNDTSVVGLGQCRSGTRGRLPRGVSPATMRAAKEKVRKWQASVAPAAWRDTTSSSLPTSTKVVVATSTAGGRTEGPQQNRTLDFAVAKPVAKSITGKRGKESQWRPAIRSGSAPTPSHRLKSPKLSKAISIPEVTPPVRDTLSVQDDMPKIANVPETPYLPPSFPPHLETSTPLPESVAFVRAKPSPISPPPTSSSTPPSSTPANPPKGNLLPPVVPHAANLSSSQPSQTYTVHPGKRSRELSAPSDGNPDDPPLTPPAKRLRMVIQNCSTPISKHSTPMSSNEYLNVVPDVRDDAREPSVGAAPSHRDNVDSTEMVFDAPLTPGRNDKHVTGADALIPVKLPSSTKSVKSYFSAPDSDPAESPVKANLLLESPVSPMLSYTRNPSGFLPQLTSTQAGKESLAAGRTSSGVFGMGYSSQFDVERHVDRVNELLARDVDFDGWLQDVRTVETSHDS